MNQELAKKEESLPAADTSQKLVGRMAARFGVAANMLLQTLRDTVFNTGRDKSGKPRDPLTDHELAAALTLCERYDLDPFTKEIYATRNRGVLLTIISIDGWIKVANRHEDYDGNEFEFREDEKGRLVSVKCRIFRKSRNRPAEAEEFLEECAMNTEPWKKWPRRMLRHKAFGQACRIAFGISTIIDADEAYRMGIRTPDYDVVDRPAKVLKLPEVQQKPAEAEENPDAQDPGDEDADLPVEKLSEYQELLSYCHANNLAPRDPPDGEPWQAQDEGVLSESEIADRCQAMREALDNA